MSSATCLSSIFFLIISINYALVFGNKPIILVIQEAIENEGSLPISIFWYHPNFARHDRLVYYSLYPQKLYVGFILIGSHIGFHELPLGILEHGESSVQYCAEIILDDGTVFSSSSCKPKNEWMYDRKNLLQDVPLMYLVIPGTHQSAAYAKSSSGSLDDQSFLSRWLHCQRESIKSQLIDGIRYLDLRPGYVYVEGKKKYMITHGVFDLISMDEVVRQINEFMDSSRDIVIVSFREFKKGFDSDDDHLSFMEYLERSFERYARPRQSWDVKLKEFWDADDKRLILRYEHSTFETSPILWIGIPQYWSNAQTINRLHSHFDVIHRNTKELYLPYVAMLALTHTMETIIQDIFDKEMSLQHWAQRLGRYIPRWYTEDWSSTASVIAVDFYCTSGIVDLAIQLNERKFEK